MMRRISALLIALVLVSAACGGAGTDEPDSGAAAPTTTAADSDEPAEEPDAPEPAQEPTTTVAQAAPSGGPSATLTLDNGETYEFSILCGLEPQESAGSTILYTFVSYDKPHGLDVTKFGEDSFGGEANISVYDSDTYDTVWEATTTMSKLLGTDISLSLDGNTVTGSATFTAGGDMEGEQVHGELVANC